MILLELRSKKYQEIQQLHPHSEGIFYVAYFPSKNYLDLLFKLNAAEPVKVAIALSKELKNILRMKLELEAAKSSTFKMLPQTKVNRPFVVEYNHQDLLNSPKNLRDFIEGIKDQELKMFLLHPIDWARNYLRLPSRTIFLSYFKTKYLVENADNFIRILTKARKQFGFRDENVMLWNEEAKRESLAAMRKNYYRLVTENALSGLGVGIFYGTFLLLSIIIVILAYVVNMAFFVLLLIQFGIFFFLFLSIKMINKHRLKKLKEIAQTEQEIKTQLDTHYRTKESEFDDEDLIQLRYF